MDIAQITPAEITIEILHPGTKTEIGLSVTVMSPDDPRMKAETRRFTDLTLQRQKRRATMTAVELEESQTRLICAAITGWDWHGEATFHGEKPAFNPENVKKVVKSVPWIREQIDIALGDTTDFFTK